MTESPETKEKGQWILVFSNFRLQSSKLVTWPINHELSQKREWIFTSWELQVSHWNIIFFSTFPLVNLKCDWVDRLMPKETCPCWDVIFHYFAGEILRMLTPNLPFWLSSWDSYSVAETLPQVAWLVRGATDCCITVHNLFKGKTDANLSEEAQYRSPLAARACNQ